MDKIHILDGNNFFSRMYFTGGNTLDAILHAFIRFNNKYGKRARIIVTFDTSKSERRLKLFPEYKAGRKSSLTEEEYENFKRVLNNFRRVLLHSGISILDGDGYEADDYISVTAKMLRSYHVFIHSTDQDFRQLVSPGVSLIVSKHGEDTIITQKNFVEICGIPREFHLDYKCMLGDKSDNIAGIPGVGEGRATKYIGEYGSYEEIVAALKEKWAGKKAITNKTEEKILASKDIIDFNRQLVDLTIPYQDKRLKLLIKEKVGKTKLDLKKILEVLSECESENMFDALRSSLVKK